MTKYMDELTPEGQIFCKKHIFTGKIIVAGDDITFVCNAKLAIPAVRYFLENLGNEKDYSACGGIAFSTVIFHFPMLIRWQKHVVTVQKTCQETGKSGALTTRSEAFLIFRFVRMCGQQILKVIVRNIMCPEQIILSQDRIFGAKNGPS